MTRTTLTRRLAAIGAITLGLTLTAPAALWAVGDDTPQPTYRVERTDTPPSTVGVSDSADDFVDTHVARLEQHSRMGAPNSYLDWEIADERAWTSEESYTVHHLRTDLRDPERGNIRRVDTTWHHPDGDHPLADYGDGTSTEDLLGGWGADLHDDVTEGEVTPVRDRESHEPSGTDRAADNGSVDPVASGMTRVVEETVTVDGDAEYEFTSPDGVFTEGVVG